MEFKSEEFLKKVEKASNSRDNKTLFDQSDLYGNDSSGYSQQNNSKYNEPNSELEDILLSSNSSTVDKKKYAVIAASLVVLFLIILIFFKVISGSNDEETLTKPQPTETISQDKALEGQNIEQEYQRIINERLKKLQEQKEAEQSQIPTQAEQTQPMQEQQTSEVQQPIVTQEPVKETVKQPVVEQKVAQPETTTKTSTPKTDAKTLFSQTTPTAVTNTTQPVTTANVNTNLKGFFIQVGAFSKDPSQNFLAKIQTSGYQYKIFKDTVNGITYNKVLVGPYNTRADASSNIENIKKALEINSAFILNF